MRRVTSFIKDFKKEKIGITLLNEVFTDGKRFHVNSFLLSEDGLDFNEFKIESVEALKSFFNDVYSNLSNVDTDVFWFSEEAIPHYPNWLEMRKFSSKKILRFAV